MPIRLIANVPGDQGSNPGRVIPKIQKMVLDTSLLHTQHCKGQINGKWSNSRKWVAPSSAPRCSSNGKREPSGRPWLRSVNLLIYYTNICIYIYIEREREGKREKIELVYIYIYMYTNLVFPLFLYLSFSLFIYIYIVSPKRLTHEKRKKKANAVKILQWKLCECSVTVPQVLSLYTMLFIMFALEGFFSLKLGQSILFLLKL